GAIGTNPAAVEFGPVCAGGSAGSDVTVQTTASGPVTISGMTPPAAPFAATATGIPGTLDGEGATMATVHATVTVPASASAGDIMDKFTLHTNIPNAADRDVALRATVLTGGTAPTPSMLDFGAVHAGDLSTTKTVALTNCAASPIMVGQGMIDGTTP